MSWTTITKIENSQFNSYSKLVYFYFGDKEVYSIITPKVLNILKVNSLNIGDNVLVIKSFSKKNEPIYFIKQLKREIKR